MGTELTELSFTVEGRVARPVAEVYEAIADPDQLSQYFTTGGAQGRLESGAVVMWDFHDFPGAFPVEVLEADGATRIVVSWAGQGVIADDGKNTVTFAVTPVDEGARTLVTITESAWRVSATGAQGAFGNCMGWTGMLAALKVWLEHGIVLREGFYK